ncbi:MAG: sugar transferase [Pseudomonadota bacterium]
MMKRSLDLATALLALVVLAPLLVVLAGLIWARMGRPILFTQTRPGRGGTPFQMVKVRTMISGDGPDGARITPLGRFLRATSLDELPELWNVVRGEMSLVGPRPLLMEYLPLYSPTEARRHEVRPGITGWAQVNGRNALSWPEKFALDVWYVDNRSLLLDLKIIGMTLAKVLNRDGISAEGEATMPRFRGSDGP